MRKLTILSGVVLVLISTLLVGCGSKLPGVKPYKMDIQQGNVVTSQMLLKLRPGMTKSQVLYIMGTPLVVDSFHSNRWDYYYQMREQGKPTEKRRVILDFDKDLLTAVRGDVVASDNVAEAPVKIEPKSVTPPKPVETSWVDKLKFWEKDDQSTEALAGKESPKSAEKVLAKDAVIAESEASSSKVEEVATVLALPAEAALSADAVTSATAAEETESVLKKNIELTETKPLEVAKPVKPSKPLVPTKPLDANDDILPPPTMAEVTSSAEADAEVAPIIEAVPEPQVIVDSASMPKTEVPVVKKADVKNATDSTSVVKNPPDVKEAVNAWAQAWRSKNINQYLGAYSNQFKPDGSLTKKAWTAQRKSRLSAKQGNITVDLEDVTVQQDGNKATVQFLQKYNSKVYSDQVTKQLDLELDAKTKRWLIVKESVIDSLKKPNQQKVSVPEAASEQSSGATEQIGF